MQNNNIINEEENTFEFYATIVYPIYYSNDTNWGKYEFVTKDDIPYFKPMKTEEGDKKSYLVGKMQELQVGAEYKVTATYSKHEKYGDQYSPISIVALIPKTTNQQLTFLKSLIAESTAMKLIEAYPNIVENVVSGEIDTIDFSKVDGVGEITWNRIKRTILDNFIISEIIELLSPLGVTYKMIRHLVNYEPNPALLKQNLIKNPYIITKCPGIGFKKADSIALKLKPKMVNSNERLISFIIFYLNDIADSEGHTWVTLNTLKNAISNNVLECADKLDYLLEHNQFLYLEDDKIGLVKMRNTEIAILKNILYRLKLENNKVKLSDEQINSAIKEAEDEQGFTYTEEQNNLIRMTLNSNVALITGKAGTGKSSVSRAILKAYKNNNYTINSCALSAMAAQRIEEASNFPSATIHRTLGAQGINTFQFNKENKLYTNVIFLDEASMVNASLFLKLLEAADDYTKIIISGDYKQLPPIGYGNIFHDLIEILRKKKIVFELTKPMRQALDSGILYDANLVRDNKNPITEQLSAKIVHGKNHDMYYLFRNSRETLRNIAIKTYLKTVETDGVDNVVIITPRRDNANTSAFEINKIIQQELLGDVKEEIKYGDISYKLGARVMQTENDYEKNVFNGEIGYIIDIDSSGNNFSVKFKNDKIVIYNKKELKQIDLAYAITCHKIQGGSSPTVIGIIDFNSYALLDNCLLYTMMTRAKKRFMLLAEPDAFLQCIRVSKNRRRTWLKNT